jgi:integrase
MTVRKRYNRHYYTDFYFRGKRIVRKIPGGIAHQGFAQQWENNFKLRLLKGEIGLTASNPDLPSLTEEYLRYSQTNKAPSSYRRDELALRTFQTTSGIIKFIDLSPQAVERYKAERSRTVSKRTVNLEITVLKTMLNRCVELGTVPDNPIRAVKKIRGPECRPIEFLTKPEVEALLPALTPAYYPIIYTYLKTGLRRNELVFLDWDDINFENKQIRVINKQAHPTKSYRERHIPIDDKLADLLRTLPRSKKNPYVFRTERDTQRANNLIKNLKRAAGKAGIKKNVTVHSLRHTYASHLVMAGVDLATVKTLLGHADIHTTMRYAHLAPDHLQDAINKLPF